MSPAAQHAQADFARFAGRFGAAVRTTDLLEFGVESCEPEINDCLPGLKTWPGIAELKLSLRRLAHLDNDLPLLLALRSAELMKLAAILLCRSSRNVLVTDLDWTPYHRLLEAEC